MKFVEKSDKAMKEGIGLVEKVRTIRSVSDEETQKVNLDSAIAKAIEDNENRASKKEIEMEYSETDLIVKGGSLLKTLFSNLIKNSIQHSNCDKIRVTVKELEEEIVCTVEDNGKGIPDEEKKKVLEKGYKKGKNAGSGLGLFLVKRIVKEYNGDINVRDSELGGARFDVHLEKA